MQHSFPIVGVCLLLIVGLDATHVMRGGLHQRLDQDAGLSLDLETGSGGHLLVVPINFFGIQRCVQETVICKKKKFMRLNKS